MNNIKFSSDYPKLWSQGSGRLVYVNMIDAEDVSNNLIEYDTRKIDGSYYLLPSTGSLLYLLFIGCDGIPFCTLRRHTQDKEKYYRGLIGKEVKLEVNDNNRNNCKVILNENS